MHVWPAKIVTPSLTYEAVVVRSEMDGDVVIESNRGELLATLTDAGYLPIDSGGWRIEFAGGVAIAQRASCGCGGSRWYDTAPDAVPV